MSTRGLDRLGITIKVEGGLRTSQPLQAGRRTFSQIGGPHGSNRRNDWSQRRIREHLIHHGLSISLGKSGPVEICRKLDVVRFVPNSAKEAPVEFGLTIERCLDHLLHCGTFQELLQGQLVWFGVQGREVDCTVEFLTESGYEGLIGPYELLVRNEPTVCPGQKTIS